MVSTKFLQESNIFQNLAEAHLEKLAAIAREEAHPAGTLLYKEGEQSHCLYIVEEGKVFLGMKGGRDFEKSPLHVTVEVVAQGEAFGWSTFVEPHIHSLSALCMDHTKLVCFDAAQLKVLMHQDASMGCGVMKGVAKLLASRLSHTRILLAGERGMAHLMDHTEYA